MGAQGHGWAAPGPAGGSEDRGPQRAPRPWAANALGRWARGWGGAAAPEPGGAWRVPGWESAKTSAPLTPPSPLHPPAGTPGRLLPVPEALWSPGPGRPCVGRGGGGPGAGAGRGAACAGPRAAGSPVAGGAAQVQRALRGELESCGRRLARAAGQSERQAQRRALRAPGGSRLRLRPYHPERARSRLISEAKQGRARLVLGWETAWEYRVL